MELVLRSARRLEREIEAEIQLQTNAINTRGVAISIYGDFDATIAQLQEQGEARMAKLSNLIEIRASIRKAIETKNETSGLNTKINREAMLKAKAKVLTQLVGAELTDAERLIASKRFEALKNAGGTVSDYGSHNDTVQVPHVMSAASVAGYNAQAKEIQRELLKLVDEMTAINTSVTITVSDDDVAYLEANSFVL
jgi:hypothetical protein